MRIHMVSIWEYTYSRHSHPHRIVDFRANISSHSWMRPKAAKFAIFKIHIRTDWKPKYLWQSPKILMMWKLSSYLTYYKLFKVFRKKSFLPHKSHIKHCLCFFGYKTHMSIARPPKDQQLQHKWLCPTLGGSNIDTRIRIRIRPHTKWPQRIEYFSNCNRWRAMYIYMWGISK